MKRWFFLVVVAGKGCWQWLPLIAGLIIGKTTDFIDKP